MVANAEVNLGRPRQGGYAHASESQLRDTAKSEPFFPVTIERASTMIEIQMLTLRREQPAKRDQMHEW